MSATGHGTLSGLWWAEADVVKLRHSVAAVRPMASMYVCGRRVGVDAAEDLDLRVQSLLHRLSVQGADEATIEAIEARVRHLGAEYAQHAIIAMDGAVVYERTLTGAVPFDQARFAAPPIVTPVLEWLFARPPHVVVAIDRAGAEITSVGGAGGARVTTTVVGPDDAIQHSAPGGWSQPRYQRRAEDSWRHNAQAVLDAALLAARRVRARLMLVAGDIRAVHLLQEQLERRQVDVRMRHINGARGLDGGVAASAIIAAVADDTDDRMAALLRHLRDDGGPAGTATEGVAQTAAALAAGRVETLVVVDEPSDARLAWYGQDSACSLLRPESVADAVHGRLVDVAVRAALLSDAAVCVIPSRHPLGPAEGIGAICRYPTRATVS